MNRRRATDISLVILRLAIAVVLFGLGGMAIVRAIEGGHLRVGETQKGDRP